MKKIDYKSFGAPGSASETQALDKRWWLGPKSERAQNVTKVVKFIAEYDSRRMTQYQISTRLYGNTDLMGVNGLSFSKINSVNNAMKDRISSNIVQSAIDTVTAKIGKMKPKALYLTSGGDWSLQQKSKKLSKFVDGIFYENDVYGLGRMVFRDACIFGDGIVHVFNHFGRVKFERVIPSELYVDFVEAFYGEPRQMHRVKNIDREVLIEMFPEKKSAIVAANGASADMIGAYHNVADQVTVVESWHLPSGPDAKDGKHSINLEGDNLFDESWNHDYFPFAKFSWSKRVYGYWGQSAAEQIQNIQLEVNKILWIIQRSFHLAGSFKVFLENGSKIVKEHLSNDIGAIVNYSGTPPQYSVPPIVPMEMYQHLQNLKTSAFEQVGVSQLSASSLKPAGLNSGKALREYQDIETERFMTVGMDWQQFYLDISKLAIGTAQDIFKENKKYQVKIPGKKFLSTIDWKEIDLEDDEYVMKAFPVSSLPDDPAGRLQTVQEYAQAGYLSPKAARRLLDNPDLEQVEDLDSAEEDYLNMIMEKMLGDEPTFTPPEPYDDLQGAEELALEYYAQGKLHGLDEERLDMLRRFMDQIDVLKQKAMPPPPPMGPAGAMPGGPAPAAPEPQPTSDLLPNVAGAA